MPALLTSTSGRPKVARSWPMPFSTCCSFVTSMPIPIARLFCPPISRAVSSAAAWLRSAMATFAPSRTNRAAISLPMPLAAPVTTATLSVRRIVIVPFERSPRPTMGLSEQIIVHDLAQTERQVRNDVGRRYNLQDGKLRHRRQRMRNQRQRSRPVPSALHVDIQQRIFHQLANAGAAIDVGDNLEQEVRGREPSFYGVEIRREVLITHGGRCDA